MMMMTIITMPMMSTTTTDVLTIREITIQKVARALGLLSQSHGQNNSPHGHEHDCVHVHVNAGVRAIECKSAGNKCLTAGRYKEALHHYTHDRRCSSLSYTNTTTDNSTSNTSTGTSEEEGDDNDDDRGTASITMPLVHQSQPYQSLQALLWLCCAKTRVQWAVSLEHEAEDDEQHDHENDTNIIKHLLQIAAADTCQVFRAYYLTCIGIGNDDDDDADNVETEGSETVTTIMDAVIATLVHRCDAGLETLGMITAAAAAETDDDDNANGKEERNKIPVDGHHEDEAEANEAVPLTNDVHILVQHCITLADAWRGLASQGIYTPALAPARTVMFQEGALMAYKGVLRIAAAPPASTSSSTSTSRTKASASSRAAARLLRAKERRRLRVSAKLS
jgi:hypothetical protein